MFFNFRFSFIIILGNLTINNSTGRYILRADDNKIQNAILTIENVSLDDRGEYKCIGRNAATEYAKVPEASDTSFVRVKGKITSRFQIMSLFIYLLFFFFFFVFQANLPLCGLSWVSVLKC